MRRYRKEVRRIFNSTGIFLTALVLLTATGSFPLTANAAEAYPISADLSCYVNAMGGVEFGRPLLTRTEYSVAPGGAEQLTMYFTKSSVTIYSVTCDTFIDPDPSYKTNDRGVMSGTIGYYDAGGNLVTDGVSYTLSDDTALNATDDAVHYVDSITFPIDSRRDTYSLTLYINSNVMGVQFTNPNSQATATTYPATLTVDWSSLSDGSSGGKAENKSGLSDNSSDGKADNKSSLSDNNSGGKADNKSDSNDDGEERTTLPPTTGNATTQESATTSDSVTQMDGLSIHSAGSDETETPSEISSDTVIAKRAYLNVPALIIIACAGAAIFVAGLVITILSVKKNKKQKGDSIENIEK